MICEWFALCDNEATRTVSHPILGDVPTCDRCIRKFDLKPNEPTGWANPLADPVGDVLDAIEAYTPEEYKK